jgi:hypothetical protein
MRAALLAGFALLLLAVPAAARPDLSTPAPAPVSALADSGAVAFLSTSAAGRCGAVGVWKPGRRAQMLRRPVCGPQTSTGSGIYGLSFGRGVLWATYAGGNFREHELWESVPTARGFSRARRVAFVSHNVDARSPLLVGEGGTYAVNETAFALRDRRYSWLLPARPLGLAVAGKLLVERGSDGPVRVFMPGREEPVAELDYASGETFAVKAQGRSFVVLRRGTLDVATVGGTIVRTLRLPSSQSYGDDHCGSEWCPLAWLRLADLQGSLAVYVHGKALHVLRVTDGKDVVVRRLATRRVHAAIDPGGLAYSAGNRVYFIPRSELDRRLRSA